MDHLGHEGLPGQKIILNNSKIPKSKNVEGGKEKKEKKGGGRHPTHNSLYFIGLYQVTNHAPAYDNF